jgi:probable rRNA maturation factor
MPHVDVRVNVEPAFADRVNPEELVRAAREAIAVGIQDQVTGWELGEMSLRITTDEEIQALNRDYRHVDRPTDVLSFAFLLDDDEDEFGAEFPYDWPAQLGDVIVSYPYAERQATDLGHTVAMELAWLTIHGTLQLLGYSHETDGKAERMEKLERTTLKSLGFTVD